MNTPPKKKIPTADTERVAGKKLNIPAIRKNLPCTFRSTRNKLFAPLRRKKVKNI